MKKIFLSLIIFGLVGSILSCSETKTESGQSDGTTATEAEVNKNTGPSAEKAILHMTKRGVELSDQQKEQIKSMYENARLMQGDSLKGAGRKLIREVIATVLTDEQKEIINQFKKEKQAQKEKQDDND